MTSSTPLSLSLTLVALAIAPSAIAQTNHLETAPRVPAIAQSPAAVPATITMSESLRALELIGKPRCAYVVFAGRERVTATLTERVQLLVPPEVIVSIGALDNYGHAYIPVDAFGGGQAGTEVYAQALLWSHTGGNWLLPNQATNAATITFHGHQTAPPQVPFGPGEQVHVVAAAGAPQAHATVGVQYGIPPRYFVELEVDVPSSGYELRVDSVAHRGSFTRVCATLFPPFPGQSVQERLRPERQKVLLGIWIGTIEVDLRLGSRPQPATVVTVTSN